MNEEIEEKIKDFDENQRELILSKLVDLKKYVLRKRIGHGSFGYVFIIEDKETNEIFAAKISKYKLNSSDFRFDEILISSSVDYPCVLGLVGFSPTNFYGESYPVLIFQYMPNGTLETFFQNFNKDNTKIFIILLGIAQQTYYPSRFEA